MADIDEGIVSFLPESSFRDKILPRFEELKAALLLIIPGADIQHVGSTAIPGSITKGDLDIQVRVTSSEFDTAKVLLAERYQINKGGFVANDAISFEDYGSKPSIGVHLTVIGSKYDIQHRFRDLLRSNDRLRRDYDELKRRFEGKSMTSYREAKANFVDKVLKQMS